MLTMIFAFRPFFPALAGAVALIATISAAFPARSQAEAADPISQAMNAAKELCQISSESGWSADGEGKVQGGLTAYLGRKFFGADLGAEMEGRIEKWDGVQQVLREHQFSDNQGARECAQIIVPQILDFRLRFLEGQTGRASHVAVVDSGLDCYNVEILLDGPVPIEAGSCFTDEQGRRMAQITSARREIVVFDNANGESIPCYSGDICGFGLKTSVRFRFIERGGNIFLVRKV